MTGMKTAKRFFYIYSSSYTSPCPTEFPVTALHGRCVLRFANRVCASASGRRPRIRVIFGKFSPAANLLVEEAASVRPSVRAASVLTPVSGRRDVSAELPGLTPHNLMMCQSETGQSRAAPLTKYFTTRVLGRVTHDNSSISVSLCISNIKGGRKERGGGGE